MLAQKLQHRRSEVEMLFSISLASAICEFAEKLILMVEKVESFDVIQVSTVKSGIQ